MRLSPSRSRLALALALVALFAFSGPGVVVAHADSDLAPSADQLFGGVGARSVPLPAGAGCEPGSLERAQQQRQQIGARIAELMKADGDDPGRALRNGHGYAADRDPMFELRRVEAEAARLRAASRR